MLTVLRQLRNFRRICRNRCIVWNFGRTYIYIRIYIFIAGAFFPAKFSVQLSKNFAIHVKYALSDNSQAFALHDRPRPRRAQRHMIDLEIDLDIPFRNREETYRFQALSKFRDSPDVLHTFTASKHIAIVSIYFLSRNMHPELRLILYKVRLIRKEESRAPSFTCSRPSCGSLSFKNCQYLISALGRYLLKLSVKFLVTFGRSAKKSVRLRHNASMCKWKIHDKNSFGNFPRMVLDAGMTSQAAFLMPVRNVLVCIIQTQILLT